MSRPVRADSRNLGKRVRFNVGRGQARYERIGTIQRFRGSGRGVQAAWIQYQMPSGQWTLTCVDLIALEYAGESAD